MFCRHQHTGNCNSNLNQYDTGVEGLSITCNSVEMILDWIDKWLWIQLEEMYKTCSGNWFIVFC
jgi:hypothetical protein